MKLSRIMIAAPGSGSGKTTITCALLQALKDRGKKPVAYKCGPDYIDPMFHRKVIGVPSKNLDTFFTDACVTRQLFLQDREEDEIIVIEGVMGLYDGLGGIREEGSSYHLARITDTPVIFVVDAKGMGKSLAALLAGFLRYDTGHLIKGVILNRMSKSCYEVMKPVLEAELKIKVLGYIPEQKQLRLESRHLGLKLPDEIDALRDKLKASAEELQSCIAMDELLRIADGAPEIKCERNEEKTPEKTAKWTGMEGKRKASHCHMTVTRPVIAVAEDEAFCFYYEDNLRMLRENGAKIVSFSPIHDSRLPENCAALLLGGGYPELYARQLSANMEMKEAVRTAVRNGMPVAAECGGFMYLHHKIITPDNEAYEMADVIAADCRYSGKLVRFGYILLEEKKTPDWLGGNCIKGHEFHYYDSTRNGEDCEAVKPVSKKNYSCIIATETMFAGFPHLYYPSNPAFPASLVQKAEQYAGKNHIGAEAENHIFL